MSAAEVKTKHRGIYQRGDTFTFRYRDRRGIVRRGTATTLTEAKDALEDARSAVRRGEHSAGRTQTLTEYGASWIETYRGRTSRGIRPETVKDYKAVLERDVYPRIGKMRLADIEPADIRELVSKLERRGLSRNSIRLTIAPLKALLATA